MSHRVPFRLLKPHVENYLRAQIEPGEEIDPYGPEVQALALRAGVHPDSISKPYQGKRESISFLNADNLIAAMNMPMIWQTPELWPYYWEGRPVPPDRSKPIKCKNPRCDAWFEIGEDPSTWKRRYCNDSCARAAQRVSHGVGPKINGEMMVFECEFCHDEVEVPRQPGHCTNRRACSKPECKRALKAWLMREHRRRRRAATVQRSREKNREAYNAYMRQYRRARRAKKVAA